MPTSICAREPLIPKLELRDVSLRIRDSWVLRSISLAIHPRCITTLLGPGGCGKTSLIRVLNGMVSMIPEARVDGSVLIDGVVAAGPGFESRALRRRICAVFAAPPLFPGTLFDNVAAGLRFAGLRDRGIIEQRVEESLRAVALWQPLKAHLNRRMPFLPLEQLRRVCLARALAINPELLILDDPTRGLESGSARTFEHVLQQLHERTALLIATRDPRQAARLGDCTAFMSDGRLVESAPTDELFTIPTSNHTDAFVTGRVA